MAFQRESRSGVWSSREAYLLGMVCLFAGLVGGWLIRGSSSSSSSPPVAASAPAAAPASSSGTSSLSLNQEVQPLLDALKANPKDVPTLINVGNAYYDHKDWSEAIRYYQQALDLRPSDINVRTDMGTAYFYSGFPDKAVAEFDKVLKVNPNYPNTLFNLGIVRRDAYKDNAGALAAWDKMLKNNPNLPAEQKQRVEAMIVQTKIQ